VKSAVYDCVVAFIVQLKYKKNINSWLYFDMSTLTTANGICTVQSAIEFVFSTLIVGSFFSDNVVLYGD